jgi:hypothetical protein
MVANHTKKINACNAENHGFRSKYLEEAAKA